MELISSILDAIPWLALILLSLGYWFQVYKIYKHKEVRDISLIGYILLALGFAIMSIKALDEGSTIFFVKQIMTLIPSFVIIHLVCKYRDQEWHDELDAFCEKCQNELEPRWTFCPDCGVKNERFIEKVDRKR